MIFDDVDVNNDPLEDVQEMELSYVAHTLLILAENPKLCSNEGKSVLAEYGYKGNFDSVVAQLNEYSLRIEKEFTEMDRDDLFTQKLRLMEYMRKFRSSYEMKSITESISDICLHSDLCEYRQDRINALHNTEMCECFNN